MAEHATDVQRSINPMTTVHYIRIWHEANCHDEDCADNGDCVGCSTTCGCFPATTVDLDVEAGGIQNPTFGKAFMVALQRVGTDDYLLKFGVVGMGSFEIAGDFATLDRIVHDARVELDKVAPHGGRRVE